MMFIVNRIEPKIGQDGRSRPKNADPCESKALNLQPNIYAPKPVHADVRREPSENARKIVVGTAMKRRLMHVPRPVPGPIRLLELMLNVEQPDARGCRQQEHRQVNQEEWTHAAPPTSANQTRRRSSGLLLSCLSAATSPCS